MTKPQMMKSTLLSVIAICFFINANAQYFAIESSEWKYMYYVSGKITVNVISVDRDTILDGYTAQVLSSYRTTYIPQQGGVYTAYSATLPYEIVRSSGDSVFHWKNEHFNLLYDFGAQVGDTWTIDAHPLPCVDSLAIVEVVQVGVTDVNGVQRRYIDLETITDTWIGLSGRCVEGIGLSSNAGVSPITGFGRGFVPGENWCDTLLFNEALPNEFICYSDDIIGSYDPFETFCLYAPLEVGIKDPSNLIVGLYPNPTTGIFTLTLPPGHSGQATLEVLDMWGRLVLSRPVTGNAQLELDLTHYPKGLYLIRLHTEREVFTARLVKE